MWKVETMLKIKKIFAIVVILAIVSAALPLSVQSDVVQVIHTIQLYQGEAKPDSPGKVKPTPVSPDYKLIINKGTTDIPVTLTVYTETAEPERISAYDFKLAVAYAADEWDDHTNAGLIAGISEVSIGSTSVDFDGINAVFFADLDTNVIAMASFWYSRATREILECDVCFSTDFNWGTDGAAAVMDVQNIATHELGHFFNLADIYDTTKDDLTMYGISWEGDTEKRSLAAGDIAGIQKVFGV
jgi:hypothetical protein